MSASKLFFTTFVLLGLCALVAGCGSDSVAPTDDEAPILPPANVTASTSDLDKLVLTWDPNSHPRLAGYCVYRLDITTQETVKLTPAPIANTQYRDMSASRGVEYEYRVTAITKSGKESIYTAIAVTLLSNQPEKPGMEL
jgi:fibronectin type 3 domain-containing protein